MLRITRRLSLPLVLLASCASGAADAVADETGGETGGDVVAPFGDLPSFQAPAAEIVEISLGPSASCARDSASGWACWGLNTQNRMTADVPFRAIGPRSVPALEEAVGLRLGSAHACAIFSGQVRCWGANEHGQVTTPGASVVDLPRVVEGLEGTNWKQVATGERSTCALRADGNVYCWGDNSHGGLGIGTDQSLFEERVTPTLVPGEHRYTQLVSRERGGYCGITTESQLDCWGDVDSMDGSSSSVEAEPVSVDLGRDVEDLVLASSHAFAKTSDGSWVAWGQEVGGSFGTPSASTQPASAGNGREWSSLSAGYLFTCALLAHDGEVYCWGGVGQEREDKTTGIASSGYGRPEVPRSLEPSPGPHGTWSELSCVDGGWFEWHCCGLTEDRSMWCWGDNHNSQVGAGAELVEAVEPHKVFHGGGSI